MNNISVVDESSYHSYHSHHSNSGKDDVDVNSMPAVVTSGGGKKSENITSQQFWALVRVGSC